MAKRCLVTGGAGFIGSHLVRALLAQGEQVRVMDDFSTGKRENLASVAIDTEIVAGDLRDLSACMAACKDIDAVYHLGALGSVPRSVSDPQTTHAVNIGGTLNILLAAKEQNVRRVVFSSSSSVYGDTPTLPKHEEMRPSPRSPYAVSKLAGEEYCRSFAHSYGLDTVVLRYFNVFGPRQDPASQYAAVIPKFLSALHEGRKPIIFGDGSQSRDFTYVANVVDANMLAAAQAGVRGEVFNIACGEQISVNSLLQHIASRLGQDVTPEYREARAGDVLHSRAAINAAIDRLGYRPNILFEEGLSKTIDAYGKNN